MSGEFASKTHITLTSSTRCAAAVDVARRSSYSDTCRLDFGQVTLLPANVERYLVRF